MGKRRPPRVLIVDDAALVRLYYRDALEKAGYTVDEAMNGLEALEKLLVMAADLLIVDVNMPRMDGLSFLRALRTQRTPIAAIPVLVTSTEASARDAGAAREAGANFYLIKPVSPDVLVEHVALMCNRPP